jgi:hypothetical protein
MPPARPDDLTWRRVQDARSEHRFVVSRALAEQVMAQVEARLAAEVHDPARPISHTRTTYFDTPRQALFRSLSPDCRVRLREYGAAAPADATPRLSEISFLELKSIEGSWRTKVRLRLPAGHGLHCPDRFRAAWQRLLVDLPAGFALPHGLRDADLVPRVTTVYRRRAWVSDDGALRVTLDADLAGTSPILVAEAPERFTPGTAIGFGQDRILEVKAVGAVPGWLERATARIGSSISFSKFRWGVAALYPVEEPGACSVAV